MTREEIRRMARQRRAALSGPRERKPNAVCQTVWLTPLYERSQLHRVVCELWERAATERVAEELWRQDCRLAYPVVTVLVDGLSMAFFEVRSLEDLSPGLQGDSRTRPQGA